MKEIFMDVKGYEGIYQVSNLGRVKNIKTGKILKQGKRPDDYMQINLYKDGKLKTHRVHRLVLEAFKANPENKLEVNHKNEDRTDNRLNNLEWCTHEENCNYGSHNERAATTRKANGTYDKIAEKRSIPVYCITNNTVYKSAAEAARKLNLNRKSITACCRGRFNSTGGYQFEYYTEGDDNNGISL